MGRDHRIIKAFVFSGKIARKTLEKSHLKKNSARDLRNFKKEMAKNPHSSSNSIFDAVSGSKVGKTTRCKELQSIGWVISSKNGHFLAK